MVGFLPDKRIIIWEIPLFIMILNFSLTNTLKNVLFTETYFCTTCPSLG